MCLFSKLKDIFEIDRLVEMFKSPSADADYYHNSENDLENIFVELSILADKPICLFNQDYFKDRVNFLANEGLNIIYSQNLKVNQTKLSKKDINDIIVKQVKAVKKPSKKKKTVKKKI
jgi:hypothetical protein